jgi:hypothetical protein
MKSEQCSVPTANAVTIRDAIARAVAWLGYKRGIHEAASAMAVKERVAKSALYGEAFDASDDRARRAREFRRDLAMRRLAKLRGELAECEQIAGEHEVYPAMDNAHHVVSG